jgi:hypothetical protein
MENLEHVLTTESLESAKNTQVQYVKKTIASIVEEENEEKAAAEGILNHYLFE